MAARHFMKAVALLDASRRELRQQDPARGARDEIGECGELWHKYSCMLTHHHRACPPLACECHVVAAGVWVEALSLATSGAQEVLGLM